MEIKEIRSKKIWEDFLLECKEKTFLQSFNWGEFQKMMGNEIWRLGIFENSELLGVAQIVKIEARRGKFLFLPHGPVTVKQQATSDKQQILEALLEELKEIAKQENCSFIRIAPILERNEKNRCHGFAFDRRGRFFGRPGDFDEEF